MIKIVRNNSDASADIYFDELGHSGTITAANIKFGTNIDGSIDWSTVALTCPDNCGSVSWHPITGDGSIRALTQELFVRQVKLKGCPCGALTPGKAFVIVIAHIKSHIQQKNGNWEVVGAIT